MMDSNENNNMSLSPESAVTNDEDGDDNLQPTTSLSTSPKRYKLDPDAPSTSNQFECNANQTNESDEHKSTDGDADCDADGDGDGDGDAGTNEHPKKSDADNKTKRHTGRFAKRNYRRSSQSSTNSVPMEPAAEQNNDNGSSSNRNNRETTPETPPFVSDDAMLSLLDEESSMSSDQDDSNNDDNDDDSLASDDTDHSTENELKTQVILNKPRPKCDLNLVRNLIYRQSGILFKGERRTYDAFATGLTQRITSSIFSVERMMLLHKLEKHYGCVNCLNFNKAGNLLVTGSDDLKVIIWNWAKCKPIIVQQSHHRSNVFQSKFVDNGSANNQTDFHLITSARDGEVRHIQTAPDGSAKDRLVCSHASSPVHKIAIPDSNPNEVLTAGEDGCIIRSDLRNGDSKQSERLIQLKENGDKIPLYSIAHHPYDPEFCICGRDRFVRVYDKRNVKECSKMFCPENILTRKKSHNYTNITCAVYNYIGSEILASYGDENIYLFDTSVNIPGTYKQSYYGHKNRQTIKGVNFYGPCSEYVMSGSDCGNFFMWDKNSEAIVQWLPGDENGIVNCLEGHPHFPIIATSGLDHDVKIWSPMNPNGRPSQVELKKCIKENLNNETENFVRTYMRNIARLVNEQPFTFHRTEQYSSDDDSEDEDDGLRTFYRPDRGPCEVQ